MEAQTLFLIIHSHGRSQHEIIEEVLPDLDVVVAVIVIIDIVIVVCQVRRDADEVKSDLICEEVLHCISEEHGEAGIEERPLHRAILILGRILMERQQHDDLRIIQRRITVEGRLHITGQSIQLGFDIVMTDLGIGTRMDDRQEGAGGTTPDSIGLIDLEFRGIDLDSSFFYIHAARHDRFAEMAHQRNISFDHEVIERAAVEPYIVSDGYVDLRQEIGRRLTALRKESERHFASRIVDRDLARDTELIHEFTQ